VSASKRHHTRRNRYPGHAEHNKAHHDSPNYRAQGCFTPDGDETPHIAVGDTLSFETDTEGWWEMDETMHHVYVIMPTLPLELPQ
jgi:hypothetical protein